MLVLYFPLMLLMFCKASSRNEKNYDMYQVYEVNLETSQHQKVLDLLHSSPRYDFWSTNRMLKRSSTVMVDPDSKEVFQNIMTTNKFKYKQIIPDVGMLLQKNNKSCQYCRNVKGNGSISFEEYNRYDTITSYLESLESKHPGRVTVLNLGRTEEGRDIIGVKLSNGMNRKSTRPAIFIDAGVHAREWIAPATALFLISQLVENTENANMLEKVDWYIVPVANPDGYEYSHRTDRFWRKTRRKERYCKGVDINRNFGYHWLEGGSSTDECSETYAGSKPFSEPETKAICDVILENRQNIKLYLTLHSYGPLILYPWSYTAANPKNVNELRTLAISVSDAVKSVRGTDYAVGLSSALLYPASGSSQDWVKGIAGIEMAYGIELPGGGETGFDLPTMQIKDVAIEMFQGFKEFWKYVEDKWG